MSENLTFNQINDQVSSAYRKQDAIEPAVLIERSDGRITTGKLEIGTRNVLFSEDGLDKMRPNVSLEKLSDQNQERLAAELAGVALHGSAVDSGVENQESSDEARIAELEASIDAIRASFSAEDQVGVWQFASSRFPHEEQNARAKLSPEGHKRMGELYKLQDLSRELSKIHTARHMAQFDHPA